MDSAYYQRVTFCLVSYYWLEIPLKENAIFLKITQKLERKAGKENRKYHARAFQACAVCRTAALVCQLIIQLTGSECTPLIPLQNDVKGQGLGGGGGPRHDLCPV
jgi:hypothetical protein